MASSLTPEESRELILQSITKVQRDLQRIKDESTCMGVIYTKDHQRSSNGCTCNVGYPLAADHSQIVYVREVFSIKELDKKMAEWKRDDVDQYVEICALKDSFAGRADDPHCRVHTKRSVLVGKRQNYQFR